MTRARQVSALLLILGVGLIRAAWGATPYHSRPLLPRRISSQIMDLGRVYPIYMVAGMATLIQLPGPVTGIRTGNPESIKYFRPDKPENEVTLVLQNDKAKPTNLILRSGKKIFVFDIVPSKTVHQDTLEVVGDYGGPQFQDAGAELIDSSDEPAKTGAKKTGGAR